MSENKGGKIYTQITAIMRSIKAVGKNGEFKDRNGRKQYDFRGIDDVCNELHRHFAEHQVFCVPKVLEADRQMLDRMNREGQKCGHISSVMLRVQYTLFANDGSSIEVVTAGEAADYGDKACNKAMSAAYKYALVQLFCIPTHDDAENSRMDLAAAQLQSQAQKLLTRKDPCRSLAEMVAARDLNGWKLSDDQYKSIQNQMRGMGLQYRADAIDFFNNKATIQADVDENGEITGVTVSDKTQQRATNANVPG